MSNPCINRWGLNSVWHHYWFSDSRYYLNLKHDALILDLLNIYLNYGSDLYTTMFWNSFWYKTSVKPSSRDLTKYYRWLSVYNDISMSTNTYPFRLSSEERFMTRISILKFNSWYVVNLYWFQPDKKRNQRLLRAKLQTYTTVQSSILRSNSSISKLRSIVSLLHQPASNSAIRYDF